MCGILAAFGTPMFPTFQLEAALSLLEHRGPDDSGSWSEDGVWLGHRRLSILDLSAAGHQPMDARDAVTITFNGEIYNYLELRRELKSKGHRFSSDTDTEVLLHAYLEWGAGCLGKLNGMWAFVIWDRRRSEAFIARDRFGVKPLYYSRLHGRTVVASEPKAILHLEPSRRMVDESTLINLLANRKLHLTEKTFYQGINSLPPGHFAVLSARNSTFQIKRYWNFPAPQDELNDIGEVVDELGLILEDSVRLRFRSDVPVGLTLSGGLDSTAILEAAMKLRPRVMAFTSTYVDNDAVDERVWAERAVSRHPGAVLNPVNAASEDWLPTLFDIVWHMDGPGSSPAVFPLWEIMASARAVGVKVLLEGQGADELFAGYAWHSALACTERLIGAIRHPRRESLHDAWASTRTVAAAQTMRNVLLNSVYALILPARRLRQRHMGVRDALRPEFRELARPDARAPKDEQGRNGLEGQLFDDFTRDALPGFLHYGDAISMAHSVENRLPFLDYRLVSLAFRLPSRMKIMGGYTKAPLRVYLRRAGQSEIASRMDKLGYPTPTSKWLAEDNGRMARDILLDSGGMLARYFKPHGLERLIDKHVSGDFGTSEQLYCLLAAEVWLKRCIASPQVSR